MPFGQEGLVATWVVPTPSNARITYDDGSIFADVDRVKGTSMPERFPEKYTRSLKSVDLFNASMAWDNQELTRWQSRHGIEMKKGPLAVFGDYIKSDHAIFSTLIEHPKVKNPKLYTKCSIVLQRGVIVFTGSRETLYLRSYFHSSNDNGEYVNFVPKGGIKMSFPADAIWYPLSLTSEIEEPASYLVLDVLTKQSLPTRQISKSFQVSKQGKIMYQGDTYYFIRITGRLDAEKKWRDLILRPSGKAGEKK